MLSISKIKFVKSLELKKNRQEAGVFVAEGVKIVKELLLSDYQIEMIYMTADCNLNIAENINYSIISTKELERISFLKNPNKVLALVKIPENNFDVKQLDEELVLALDNINNPGNLGTVIRVANWYGISTVLCNINCVDCFNPKVIQSSMGANFKTKLYYFDLQEILTCIKSCGNLPIYAAELTGTSLYEIPLNKSGIIIIGNESHGISSEISLLANYKLKIPSFPDDNATVESLNAGVAAGIICAEFRRQM